MIPFIISRRLGFALPLLFLLAGCAGKAVKPGTDPQKLYAAACEPGSDIQSVKGSIWMKATSKGMSGQFPAQVVVHAPDTVHMEVTNLIGATQAVIDVQDGNYKIQALDKKGELKPMGAGKKNWGGIPLRWASDLFLGRVPCLPESSRQGASVTVQDDGSLQVKTETEVFTYRFRNWAGRPWPEALEWETLKGHKGDQKRVEFKFDDPEDKTRSPKKWEAHSSDGEVKVRWKDREIAR